MRAGSRAVGVIVVLHPAFTHTMHANESGVCFIEFFCSISPADFERSAPATSASSLTTAAKLQVKCEGGRAGERKTRKTEREGQRRSTHMEAAGSLGRIAILLIISSAARLCPTWMQ